MAKKMFRPAFGCAQHPKAGLNTQLISSVLKCSKANWKIKLATDNLMTALRRNWNVKKLLLKIKYNVFSKD